MLLSALALNVAVRHPAAPGFALVAV